MMTFFVCELCSVAFFFVFGVAARRLLEEIEAYRPIRRPSLRYHLLPACSSKTVYATSVAPYFVREMTSREG